MAPSKEHLDGMVVLGSSRTQQQVRDAPQADDDGEKDDEVGPVWEVVDGVVRKDVLPRLKTTDIRRAVDVEGAVGELVLHDHRKSILDEGNVVEPSQPDGNGRERDEIATEEHGGHTDVN